MKSFLLALIPLSMLAQSVTPTERWGLSQNEVLKIQKQKPIDRTDHSLTFRAIEGGIPARQIFEFTNDALDQISYLADVPAKGLEVAFLKWSLALTKEYGQGDVYFDKKPVGRPGVVLDQVLSQLWKEKDGEVVIVFPQTRTTTVGVAISMKDGKPFSDLDFARTP